MDLPYEEKIEEEVSPVEFDQEERERIIVEHIFNFHEGSSHRIRILGLWYFIPQITFVKKIKE